MASDPKLNSLLKWAVENSSEAKDGDSAGADSSRTPNPQRGLDAEALQQLMGGPSDADRMNEAMAVVHSPDIDLDNKIIAFENFQFLVENIDNANNMESLGLWMPLVEQLNNPEAELRRIAAWCVGTAVQNNQRAQERCLVLNAIGPLAKMAQTDSTTANRKKAIFALSSEVRNYQAGMDSLLKELPAGYSPSATIDAGDMEAVDSLINKMRAQA